MYKVIKYCNSPDVSTAKRMLSLICEEDTSHYPRKVDKPLALYGAGNLGRMAYEYLNKIGINVDFVIDNNAEKYRFDKYWSDVKIVSPSQIEENLRHNTLLAVTVVTTPYVELATSLYNEGWSDVVPFYDISEAYRDRHPLSNGWFVGPFNTGEIDNISRVLKMWDDDVSRANQLQFIAWHRLRQEWLFDDANVRNDDRYFISQILDTLTENESFLDIGAHKGEVTDRFLQHVNYKFNKIWMIEPDPVNLKCLNLKLNKKEDFIMSKVVVYNCAVGKIKECKRFYNSLGYASQICEFGNSDIELTTIDDLSLSPTFIKIHLEGWELDVLNGAIVTIKKYRPVIVTTIYHNELGLWKIPFWFQDNLSEYSFLLRAHSWCGTGLVLYAIPKERIKYDT